ncbi:hypothetical protein E4630_14020 [Aeromonas hydrophila]|uniref:hypothetical protein n=1 Tax=Aeromonas hydrophila TaxID=644 RepID=UPI00107ED7D6|nr:hypothetical protein [Aeromonas hydrophila]QBX71872.1 hypothetical protein E4625_14240 [Aeromonas hydrophila]QBX76571.1 hypothetical protein E4630_14020 [Aeromonas hydrophila]
MLADLGNNAHMNFDWYTVLHTNSLEYVVGCYGEKLSTWARFVGCPAMVCAEQGYIETKNLLGVAVTIYGDNGKYIIPLCSHSKNVLLSSSLIVYTSPVKMKITRG